MKRTKKPISSLYLWPFLIIVCVLGLAINLVTPDMAYSEAENRPLRSFPAPTAEGLWSGETESEFDLYVSDQLAGRSELQHVSYLIRKASGQRVIDDVYLGSGMLLIETATQDDETAEASVAALNRFADATGLPVRLMVVPNSGQIQSQKLPWFAPPYDEIERLQAVYAQGQGITTLSVSEKLENHRDEYIYYRTDHHWTSLGAGLCAYDIAQEDGYSLDLFDFLPVSRSFEGTLASRTGSVLIRDDIDIAVARNLPEYLVTWADGTRTASIYNQDALYRKNQYEVFLGANQGLVEIETLADSQRSLLLFKDSYANSMVQFLLPYFKRIIVVDPRYFYEDIDYVISTYGITEVAAVYSFNTFFTDSSLQGVLDSVKTDDSNREEQDEYAEE